MHHEHYSLFTSTNMKCVLVAQGSSTNCSVIFCVHENSRSSGQPCHPLAGLYLLSSSPQHEAPPGQHDLLQDDTEHREPVPKTTRRKATLKNRSRTSITGVAKTCEQTLPRNLTVRGEKQPYGARFTMEEEVNKNES